MYRKPPRQEKGQKSFDGLWCDAVLSTMGKLATADVEQEMTNVSGTCAQWQSSDLFFLNIVKYLFLCVWIIFACALWCRYKQQIFPHAGENEPMHTFCIPFSAAVPDFLVCSGTGWWLQSEKIKESFEWVFTEGACTGGFQISGPWLWSSLLSIKCSRK